MEGEGISHNQGVENTTPVISIIFEGKAMNEQSDNSRLPTLAARIERLEAERADVALAVREIYTEAKSAGYEVKILRKLIAERKLDADKVAAAQSMLEIYRDELTAFESTPLGRASAPAL